jgi:hypothetical protein
MVDELIDTVNMCWSEEKLEENFIETDRRAIRQIPLGRFLEDEWGWTHERNGCFSVRSTYKLISSLQQANVASGSGDSTTNACWRKLWKLQVPPKVRSFWWRAIKKNYSDQAGTQE